MIPTNLIPIGDYDPPRQRFHLIVWVLLLANIGVFLYQIRLGEERFITYVYQYGAIPYELTNNVDIPPLIDFPIWVTIFTSMFMHGGLLHLGSNMLFLWIFGDNIEAALGRVRFVLFYLLCGLGALAAQVFIDTDATTPMVGASGAIAGILAAYLVLFPHGQVRVVAFFVIIPLLFRMPAIIVIGLWIMTQIMAGYFSLSPVASEFSGGVAYIAHIGGFATGLYLILLWRRR